MLNNIVRFCFLSILAFASLQAHDELKNLPELKLPLTDKKLVIAHNMTHIIRYKNHFFEDGCNNKYYPVKDNLTESLGGYTQVNVIADTYLINATLEEAIEYELRAAQRCGIDGFQFYYTLGATGNDHIIETYFKVAHEKKIDFKFTFCFSHPSGSNETQKLSEYASRVSTIMEHVGRNNPHWLRTPDGRLIVYLWYGEQLADAPPHNERDGKSTHYYAAKAYSRLAEAVGERFACVYSINEKLNASSIHQILDYFPAIWLWTGPYETQGYDETAAKICDEREREYTASVFNDFYTSKLLKRNSPNWEILGARNAVAAGINSVERKYLQTGLSQTFRNQLELAIKKDASIINVITWNDYPEGHHMAPEVNHNYGFAILLNHYKSILKGKKSPYQDRDVAITFFKKYNNNIKPAPFNIYALNLGSTAPAEYEDCIEVVTILPRAAQLVVNDEVVDVPAGLTVNRFPHQAGPVKVAIMRHGKISKSFKTPEWITDQPVRTDRLTYSFSTEFQNFHNDIFGNMTPIYATEYNKDYHAGLPLDLTYTPSKPNKPVTRIEWKDRDLTSLDGLKPYRDLEVLNLAGNKRLENISALANLKKLRVLDLSYTNVSNIEPLKNLTNLEELYLSHNPNFVWVGNLKNLHNLKVLRLTLSGINEKESCLEDLAQLKNLELLDLSQTNLSPEYVARLRAILPAKCHISF